MKLYLLMCSFWNNCDSYDNLIEIFLNQEDAQKEMQRLAPLLTDEDESYWIQERIAK